MTLKSPIQFPIFAPAKSPFHHRPATTEVRFSRWNNANAEKFNRDRRTQKEIEDQLRYQKRFDSAHNIAYNYNPAPPTPTFKSTGTPSSPSRPSIPGKKSKYSKDETPESSSRHPAFKPIIRKRKIPKINRDDEEEDEDFPSDEEALKNPVASVTIEEKGVCYEFPDAPFLYQYSYTETPKAKPQGIREPLVAPFEPGTMGRPWTGRKPLPPSKKKLREFDSFRLPPPGKKGVKPVQAPGPYLAGTGPRYVKSREEVLGEPLTPEEVKTLVESASKCTRQLNIGRDGLTHNMLENIHALWKRRRVCKIKCKGVCTVDMDNVRQQLEEKTGGKIIFSRGGVVFLFRGRNYNNKNRPRFPLMLWKPASPVYPRLIKRVPEGLTLEEANEMRKKGRDLTPICKLGKNGVYSDLVKNVREAFEECELVRINCQGLNGSDYRKIGAKLKDLVPCVLISFEHEHLLMWRGRDWQSSLPELKNDANGVRELNTDTAAVGPKLEGQAQSLTASAASTPDMLVSYTSGIQNTSTSSFDSEDVESEESREYGEEVTEELIMPSISSESIAAIQDIYDIEKPPPTVDPILGSEPLIEMNRSEKANDGYDSEKDLAGPSVDQYDMENILSGSEARPGSSGGNDKHTEPSSLVLQDVPEKSMYTRVLPVSISPEAEGVLLLRKEAVESGSAIVLDSSSLDAVSVYERAVALAHSAPPGPVFRRRSKKLVNKEPEEQRSDNLVPDEAARVPEEEVHAPSRKGSKKSSKNRSMKDIRGDYLNVVPRGSLGVDELAKLLS